jgi:scyllo-inositol 2-dehydrogenase (NADP+)
MRPLEYQRPPVRVALMGLGRAMFNDHYQVYLQHPALFKVVAACDTLKERRDIVAKDFPECRMFRQIGDMLDERDIDLVDIATCTEDHVEHALMSLKKGFWTLLETPMALDVADAQILRGQSMKTKGHLIIAHRGLFAPDYLLAKQMMTDLRLGPIYSIRIRREDYVRRDDWQCIKRMGGGAAYYAMPDLMLQTLRLLPTQPVQMWSELKRIASLGDCEDYVHVCLKTREMVSADVEFSGGAIPGFRSPSFEIRGERGVFRVEAGATEGTLTCIDPKFSFPRRRSSVRTPSLDDPHEDFPVLTEKIALPKGTLYGPTAFWKCIYDTVRTAAPFPLQIDESIETIKFAQLMKKTSPYGK